MNLPVKGGHNDVVKNSNSELKRRLRLPEFQLEPFNGDLLKWQTSIETFEASVDSHSSSTNIEKFTYLKGYVVGKAAQISLEGE